MTSKSTKTEQYVTKADLENFASALMAKLSQPVQSAQPAQPAQSKEATRLIDFGNGKKARKSSKAAVSVAQFNTANYKIGALYHIDSNGYEVTKETQCYTYAEILPTLQGKEHVKARENLKSLLPVYFRPAITIKGRTFPAWVVRRYASKEEILSALAGSANGKE